MKLGRLNGDATWWCELGGARLVFDPWLVGSEIDYARWFNEAWHTDPVVAPHDAGRIDLVIVSQSYADHCHPATLSQLDAPVAAVPGCGIEGASAIPPWGTEPLRVGALRIWRLSRPWFRPPAYHAIVVADDADRAVLHAPHGLPAAVATQLEGLDFEVVAVTRARYQLPFFLGGAVNPGDDAARALVEALRPRRALAIHDEAKRAEGLVSKLARVDRGPFEAGPPWIECAVDAGETSTR